ncbi:hypothetical protein ACFWHT_03290 [Microbacterium sp. NPDC058342]|uniref:hypothetical protein n=1 Tax=Microbacterium sp. NPDC058342 TaxID=3346454 RepID=UPI00364EC0C8
MTILDERRAAPSRPVQAERTARRNALDASIERELRKGEGTGHTLHARHWDLLNTLIEYELQQPAPATEATLFAATPIFGPFRGMRFQQRLTWLLRLGLVRRERSSLRPTLAGFGAARPFSTLPGSLRPPQALLRELRRGEIGSL